MDDISKPQEKTGLWLIKIFSGALVFIVLGILLVVNHLVAPEGLLTYTDILRYYASPIVPIMEIAFLVVVVSHALTGFRSILLDLNLPGGVQRIIDYVLVAAGMAAIIYGTWLVLVVVSRGSGI